MKRGLSVGDLPSTVGHDVSENVTLTQATRRNSHRKAKKSRYTGEVNGDHASSTIVGDKHSQINTQTSDTSTDEICVLKNEIDQLKQTVRQLTDQLGFVLSYLGVTDSRKDCVVGDDSLNSGMLDFPPLVTQPLMSEPYVAATTSTSTSTAAGTSYSSVVRKPLTSAAPTLKDYVAKELLSVVYVEQEQKKRRANNIVISGLPEAPVDRESVKSFLKVEFDEIASEIKVTGCRRLGQKQDGRIQPLLVTCSSAISIQFILDNAKRLRRSGNSLVRDCIYINPDLTKAEALAAFEIRQKRRAARARNIQRKETLGGRSQLMNNGISTGTSSNVLNLDAAPFQPISSAVELGSSRTGSMEDSVTCNSE